MRNAVRPEVGTLVVFGLGSNVGDGEGAIRNAIERLQLIANIDRVSSIYRSEPMYRTDQPAFANAVAIARTDFGPWPLLREIKEIERSLGRVDRGRNGPREIDIDIVAYGSLRYQLTLDQNLVLEIPHPRLGERRFVLLPLAEIAPSICIPGLGLPSDLLARTEHQSEDVTPLRK